MTPTRIEFAPGHEDEAITEQDVAAKLRLMKAAGQLYDAAAALVGSVTQRDARGRIYALSRLHAAVDLAEAALAAADGRSQQESA